MALRLTLYRYRLWLKAPYVLSFGTVRSFESFYAFFEGEGRLGLGEITPLHGYNHETPDTVLEGMACLSRGLRRGGRLVHLLEDLVLRDPFAASGIACAYETWREGLDKAYLCPVETDVPIAALCDGRTPQECQDRARELAMRGFGTLKMKVGRFTPEEEVARARAAAGGAGSDCDLRLDANQCLTLDQAVALCEGIEDLENLELLEQPFGPDRWREHEKLISMTSVPIMLDESIWGEDDVLRASDCGARLVKLKLCKHLGMEGSRRLARLAFNLGLDVVYGNGVQTAVGNHLEASLFHDMSIKRASEGNGFLKPALHPFSHGMGVVGGKLVDKGFTGPLMPPSDRGAVMTVEGVIP